MNVGAFVCSCGGSCEVDLDGVRDGVRDVDVVASSELLCQDGLDAMSAVVDEYELDELIVTAPDRSCRDRIRDFVGETGLHPEAAEFVNHREECAWVHDADAATEKTARMINATAAGRREEAVSRTVSREAGETVAVVGDPAVASSLAESADVTLLADGRDFEGAEDLGDVTVERGRVVDVSGEYGEFEVTVEARVTDECISCMDCVAEGPEGMVTAEPVDIDPDAPDGEWVEVCPTDAIDLDGVTRALEFDQVVHPDGTAPARGGQLGFYTGPVDAATVSAVVSNLGGIEKPDFLDLEMEVCAAGASSQQGCTACVDACPHGAVDRPAVDEVSFDPVSCQNCGACTSACPTGATKLREPSNERIAREVEALLTAEDDDGGWLPWRSDTALDTEIVAFVCSERARERLRAYGRRAREEELAYPPILPVGVNCTDTVGEAHVMHALAAGADGVAIVGCGGDCVHSGPEPKAELVDRLGRATRDLGLGERVGFFAPEADDPGAFVEDLSRFAVETVAESPVPSDGYEAEGGARDDDARAFNSHDWTLESVRRILDHVDPEREVVRGLKDFGRMEVADACNLTPTCSTLCPTDAIRRTDDADLEFNHERCVNCGLCEEGCPETAITMRDGLDLSLLPENRAGEDPAWSRVHDGEMLECVRCGKPFASAGTATKIEAEVGDLVEGIAPASDHSIFEYCGDCRTALLFEGGRAR
ncbi:hydrogenase iron-sulfur subunit [Halorussus salilacus]|uniref:hydrogenase iron-sulfur subunit n=1 Tax=Halorussus salilacus TaxID=2953750 RepID=UPI00209D2C5B|nr:hydrogenase iron-sulfur subunit [Halorussus salilacus]USZ66907.1 hydrogenase iron-sulfur subunit [Halorussus salilacus]